MRRAQVIGADLCGHAAPQGQHELRRGLQIAVTAIAHRRMAGKHRFRRQRAQETDKIDAMDGNPRDQAALPGAVAEKGRARAQTVGFLGGKQTDFAHRARLD